MKWIKAIGNKWALFGSLVLLGICMSLFFPFPNNRRDDYIAGILTFPIRNQDGYVPLGIVGVGLFLLAMFLLVKGMSKYRKRIVMIVVVVYILLPQYLIAAYQETLASGINAISYDGKGTCEFETKEEGQLNSRCNLTLQNRSNQKVTFELEFVDSISVQKEGKQESRMNANGPFTITIPANTVQSIELDEDLPFDSKQKQSYSASFNKVHIKLLDNETSREL